jgi:hypothetical protein
MLWFQLSKSFGVIAFAEEVFLEARLAKYHSFHRSITSQLKDVVALFASAWLVSGWYITSWKHLKQDLW